MTTVARLEELLAEAGTEACVLAREALTAGIPPEFWGNPQPTRQARSLYGRREHTSRRAGQGSIGFEAAVRALCAYPGAAVARVQIDGRPRARYFFEVFLTPDFTRVVACFGVSRPDTRREDLPRQDAPPWSPLDEIVHSHRLEKLEKIAKLQQIPDAAAGLAAGLERTSAMRRWSNFCRHAELVPAFPSPAAERHLAEARARALADEYSSALLMSIIDDALAAVREVTHVRVRWHHDDPDQPVLLYSELDAVRHEIRKVEVYRDGHGDRAGPGEATGSTRLGSEPVPEWAEIAAQPQFTPEPITAAVFETAWRAAGMNTLATEFTASFEKRCGYPPDVNRVVLATAPANGISGELAALYDVVHEVSLPDVGNGYFIHTPEMVLRGIESDSPTRLTGTAEDSIVVFGSDGGGGLFALSTSGRGVYRMAAGSFHARGAPYDGGDVTVVAPDIGRFLDFLRARLRDGGGVEK